MASQQTLATRKILANVERSLKASCVPHPDIMINCILDEATDLSTSMDTDGTSH